MNIDPRAFWPDPVLGKPAQIVSSCGVGRTPSFFSSLREHRRMQGPGVTGALRATAPPRRKSNPLFGAGHREVDHRCDKSLNRGPGCITSAPGGL